HDHDRARLNLGLGVVILEPDGEVAIPGVPPVAGCVFLPVFLGDADHLPATLLHVPLNHDACHQMFSSLFSVRRSMTRTNSCSSARRSAAAFASFSCSNAYRNSQAPACRAPVTE